MSRCVFLLCAALLAATPSLAPAADLVPGKPATAAGTVVLAGLDLSTSAGITEARKRLITMSERLCRKFRDDREVADWENYVACVRTALAGALERIQTPTSSVAGN